MPVSEALIMMAGLYGMWLIGAITGALVGRMYTLQEIEESRDDIQERT